MSLNLLKQKSRWISRAVGVLKTPLSPASIPARRASCPTRNNLDLTNRVALVTGGTNGIGFEIAKRLGKNGATVVVSSRTQENVDRAVDKLHSSGLKQVYGMACHIANEDARKQMISDVVSSHGDINILVQNAGVNPHAFGILETPGSVVDKTCQVHIKANFQIVQEVQTYMQKSDKPCSIVLTSSASAYMTSYYPGIYAITKAGVNAMTRAFAPALSKDNIRINCVTIGPIDTDFMTAVEADDDMSGVIYRNLIIKRMGKPEEVAGMAAYLASDDASYVTGESFTVSGGAFCRF